MSYQRAGYPLVYFKGISKSYVFPEIYPRVKKPRNYDEHPEDYETKVCDYSASYRDTASFADLLLRIILRETNDIEWTFKIAKVLAKKLKIENKLRDHTLTFDEWNKESNKLMQEFQNSKEYKKIMGKIK